MQLEVFETAADLVKWAQDNSLLQNKTFQIVEKDGQWYLFYFSP